MGVCIYTKTKDENMNTKYVIFAILAIVVLVGSIAAYVYLSQLLNQMRQYLLRVQAPLFLIHYWTR